VRQAAGFEIVGRRALRRSGGIDQNVDRTELALHCRDHACCFLGRGEVGRVCEASIDPFSRRIEIGLQARGDADAATFPGQQLGAGEADSFAAAGDEGVFPQEAEIHRCAPERLSRRTLIE